MLATPSSEVPDDLPSTPAIPLTDPSLYDSRELTWLEFNDRVLEEASDESSPLIERLKFSAIYATNLDEFFMIRIAALKQQVEAEVHKRSDDGRLPEEQLHAVSEKLRVSLDRSSRLLRERLLPELDHQGVRIVGYEQIDESTREGLRKMFDERIFPVLTPLAVDRGHPFPYISNLSLSLGVEMIEQTADGPTKHFARVKVPSSLPRFVAVPAPFSRKHFVLLEDIIAHNLPVLFPGMDVRASYCFRVTRDADLDLQEDEADDLLQAIESELRKRRFGEPVRLEVARDMPHHLRRLLLEALSLEEVDLYAVDGPLGTSDLWGLIGSIDFPELRDAPFTPSIPKRLVGASDIFSVIRDGDLLLHHPYESFDPVVQFVQQAAEDPAVLAIKQTLYRTSGDSPVVGALMKAAENGKQVAVLIELKARFDEENNIQWAKNLERVGAHVVYGLPGLKTHGKVMLVVRDEPDGIRRYVHFGTGNYNEKTARIYTDCSLFTCNPRLAADASNLFNALTGISRTTRYDEIMVAPHFLRSRFLELIERETAHALAGRPSGIRVKLNAITDAEITRALYRASQAGVAIDLIVRGMCVLRPGIPGISETITVRSIVGRFLEHSRIFVFANGGDREVYMGSADWMGRNLDRRVETVVPVHDPDIARRLVEITDLLLADNVKARTLLPNGSYVRRPIEPGEEPISAQATFLERALSG